MITFSNIIPSNNYFQWRSSEGEGWDLVNLYNIYNKNNKAEYYPYNNIV